MPPAGAFCALTLLLLGPAVSAAASPAAVPRSLTAVTPAARTPEADLSRGKLAYERGDYEAAVQILRPLLYPAVALSDEQQVVQAHKLLGLSFFFLRDEAGAEQEFTLLLSLRPDFALDPVVEPLKAVAFVDGLRRRNEARLAEVRRRQAAEEERRRAAEEEDRRRAAALQRQNAPRVYVERVVQKRFSALTLLPFGVPQLADHRRTLGVLLASGEAVSGAASLGTWLTVRLRYPAGTFPPGELTTARALTGTYLATGALFWGLCAFGLIDALLHARTTTTVRELPGPPADLPRKRPARAALRVIPLVPLDTAPGAGILGLGGSF